MFDLPGEEVCEARLGMLDGALMISACPQLAKAARREDAAFDPKADIGRSEIPQRSRSGFMLDTALGSR